MKKTCKNILIVFLSGVLSSACVSGAWAANVVTVSSLPSSSTVSSGSSGVGTVNVSSAAGTSSIQGVSGAAFISTSGTGVMTTGSPQTSKSNVVVAASCPDNTVKSSNANVVTNSNPTGLSSVSVSSTTVSANSPYVGSTTSGKSSVYISSTPVVDAISTLDDSNSNTLNSSNYGTATYKSKSSKEVSVIEAKGGYDDASAQDPTTSDIGFCVILSSSPTGTMKDVTG